MTPIEETLSARTCVFKTLLPSALETILFLATSAAIFEAAKMVALTAAAQANRAEMLITTCPSLPATS